MAVNGGVAGVFPAWKLDSSSCGPAGVAVSGRNSSSGITREMASSSNSSSSSMAVGIVNISPISLYSGNGISRTCNATSSVVPLINSNALVHRHNIRTSAEDRRLGLEGRAAAGRTPRGTKINHQSQRTHRWALYTSVRDAEGANIWPASVGYHGGLRGTAPLVKSTVIYVASALRHAGPSPCSRMPTCYCVWR